VIAFAHILAEGTGFNTYFYSFACSAETLPKMLDAQAQKKND
jgi:hypothetical protein